MSENYQTLIECGLTDNLDVIFVSSDKGQTDFDGYYKTMTFSALPFDARDIKGKLSARFGVQGIPFLIVIDRKGTIICKDARGAVQNCRGEIIDLVEKWKAMANK